MVQIGGFDSTLVDFEIPRKYGLNFTIADTTGPGGLFRALRTFPMLTGLCRDMMELCPQRVAAQLLQPDEHEHADDRAHERRPRRRAVPQRAGHVRPLMRYIGEDPRQVAFACAGINHMAFYLRLEKDGVDLYPRLFEAMNRPGRLRHATRCASS